MKKYFLVITLSVFCCNCFAQAVFKNASWISPASEVEVSDRPCLVFKKSFTVRKSVVSAVLFVTAHGLYEARINGKKVGDAFFTPGYTAYGKRLQYQRYDVRSMLSASNTVLVTVGDGWWRGRFGNAGKPDNYGKDAFLLLQLDISYADGTSECIASDGSWTSSTGPIRSSGLYDGETYDASVVPSVWRAVKIGGFGKDNLVPTMGEPVRKHEVFKPVKVWAGPGGEQLVDFGQNLAGWVKFRVRGKKGDTVRIYHGEALDRNGALFRGNLRTAKATDTYILSGKGVETFEPHFTYHGFRYIAVAGAKLVPADVEAVALYTDLKLTGTFSCSNPKLNQLQHNILWSMKSNFFDIPTDCPQRSERLGWTEDADVFCATASYLMDVKDFYGKWLADLAAEQNVNGCVPATAPLMWGDNTKGIAGWSDAATFTPWTIYQRYGDTAVLSRQYASMKAWVDHVTSVSPGHLWKAGGFGDWYPAGPATDIGYLDQCYWYRSTWIMLETAKILGHPDDVKKYSDLLAAIKTTFDQTYLDHIPETQTAYVVGIAFGLLPKSKAAKLAELVKANNHHLATGFMGTPYLLQVLSENGYTDLAYRLLLQEDTPSWLYMVDRGATTMWEKWDAVKPDGAIDAISLNHYAFGSIGHWLYENIAGIRPAAPGYGKIIFRPEMGGGLTWAKGSYLSAHGLIRSEWQLKAGKILLDVEVPAGTSAEVFVPGQKPVNAGPGKHHYTGRL